MAGALSAVSCSEKDATEPLPQYLEVNAHNISGNWMLQEWNSKPLADGTQMYIRFIRDDKAFEMWDTMDSPSDIPHYSTGEFNITTDVEYGSVLNGKYDYDQGLWKHLYSVQELTSTQMLWVALDDPEFTQLFVRVDAIPFE